MADKILEVRDLKVSFKSRGKTVQAVRGLNIEAFKSEMLGIVGESGSGKSVAVKAIINILPENAVINAEKILLENTQLLGLDEKAYRKISGREIAMIFQDPMTALDPVVTVGRQLGEVIARNSFCSQKKVREKALKMLENVGIPFPERCIRQYPHEFSGGMRQRVLIAMALACNPKLLLADEPTTALDVTIQAQILDIIKNIVADYGASVILITHDLGVVAQTCKRVAVMYGGLIMETGTVNEIFYTPMHPYTMALLRAIPSVNMDSSKRLKAIEGFPPSLIEPPLGCPFADRCDYTMDICRRQLPDTKNHSLTHSSMCFLDTDSLKKLFAGERL